MINAMTAFNISEEARKNKGNIWMQIDEKIKNRANAGGYVCKYDVYPDSSVSVEEIVKKLKNLGFEVEVNTYNEAELEFEAEYCHELTICWSQKHLT